MPREIINVQVSCLYPLWRACIDFGVGMRLRRLRSLTPTFLADRTGNGDLRGCCRCGRAELMDVCAGAGCRLEIRSGRASGGCSSLSTVWTRMGWVTLRHCCWWPQLLKPVTFGGVALPGQGPTAARQGALLPFECVER